MHLRRATGHGGGVVQLRRARSFHGGAGGNLGRKILILEEAPPRRQTAGSLEGWAKKLGVWCFWTIIRRTNGVAGLLRIEGRGGGSGVTPRPNSMTHDRDGGGRAGRFQKKFIRRRKKTGLLLLKLGEDAELGCHRSLTGGGGNTLTLPRHLPTGRT